MYLLSSISRLGMLCPSVCTLTSTTTERIWTQFDKFIKHFQTRFFKKNVRNFIKTFHKIIKTTLYKRLQNVSWKRFKNFMKTFWLNDWDVLKMPHKYYGLLQPMSHVLFSYIIIISNLFFHYPLFPNVGQKSKLYLCHLYEFNNPPIHMSHLIQVFSFTHLKYLFCSNFFLIHIYPILFFCIDCKPSSVSYSNLIYHVRI